MCEFRVKLEERNGEKDVANDIVYVKLDERGVVLKDVTGMTFRVDSAIVSYVNVTSEELRLVEHPLIGVFLKLLSKLASSNSTEGARALWEAFIKEGEKLLEATRS